jgi:hypothetical protein
MRPVSCLALLLAAALSPAAAKDYRAERYDVTLNLDRQGKLTVTETVAFQFLGGPFHFVYRDLETRYTDGISDIRASEAANVEISGESPIKVRWNFEPISDVTRTFTLSYAVAGAVQKTAAGDLFVWHPLPRQRSYRIADSRIRVEYPTDLTPLSSSLSRSNAQWQTSPGVAAVELNNLSRERYPQVALRFPAGAFLGPTPQWQSGADRHRSDFFNGLFNGFAVGLLISALVWLWGSRGGAQRLPDDRSMRLPEPPDSLPPAAAAALIRRPFPAAGILIELARRGIVRIDEIAKSRFGGRKFSVVLLQPWAQMTPYERLFVEAGFRGGKTEVEMTRFVPRTQRVWYKVGQEIQLDLIERGLIDPAGIRARTRWGVTAALALMAGPPSVFAGLLLNRSGTSGLVTAAGAALICIGIAALVTVTRISRWTDAGASVAARWRAYFRHLRDAAHGQALSALPDDAERWLPYAAAFGIAAQLVRRRKKEGISLDIPDWFALFQTETDSSDAFVAFLGTPGVDGSGGAGAAAAGGAAGGGGGASGAG